RRRHTRFSRDWSSDVCSSDLEFTGRRRARGVGPQPQRSLPTRAAVLVSGSGRAVRRDPLVRPAIAERSAAAADRQFTALAPAEAAADGLANLWPVRRQRCDLAGGHAADHVPLPHLLAQRAGGL